jgi:cell division protein YceG involved in septum cleavage
MKKKALLKIMVAVLGIMAIGLLAINILGYSQVSREISAVKKDEQVVIQMQEVTKLILLKQQLENSGSSNNATKQELSARIDTSLAKIKAQRSEVSPTVNESIDVVLKVASKTQNEKTVYNLSLAQQAAR